MCAKFWSLFTLHTKIRDHLVETGPMAENVKWSIMFTFILWWNLHVIAWCKLWCKLNKQKHTLVYFSHSPSRHDKEFWYQFALGMKIWPSSSLLSGFVSLMNSGFFNLWKWNICHHMMCKCVCVCKGNIYSSGCNIKDLISGPNWSYLITVLQI